jgi:hypothetical protein
LLLLLLLLLLCSDTTCCESNAPFCALLPLLPEATSTAAAGNMLALLLGCPTVSALTRTIMGCCCCC